MPMGYASAAERRAAAREPGMSGGEQAVDRHHHVVDRPDAAEFVRLDALAGHFLQLDGEVDGIDAVEIEVAVEVRFRRDARRIDLDGVGEELAQAREDLGLRHAAAPWERIRSASVRTERKCSRMRWSPRSKCRRYFFCRATPSSSASIESSPSPSSVKSSVSSPMSSGRTCSRFSTSTRRYFNSRSK